MTTMTQFDQQVEALQQWFDSPRFARVLRLYSARQVAAQRGGIAVDSTVAREAAAAFPARLRQPFAERRGLTTSGPSSPRPAGTDAASAAATACWGTAARCRGTAPACSTTRSTTTR